MSLKTTGFDSHVVLQLSSQFVLGNYFTTLLAKAGETSTRSVVFTLNHRAGDLFSFKAKYHEEKLSYFSRDLADNDGKYGKYSLLTGYSI